jgi:hypothetical protein
MSKQERLSSPQLLLEYAKDELDAAGLYVAATLAADAMVFVEDAGQLHFKTEQGG